MIKFNGVNKSFGGLKAIKNLSFEAKPNQITAIIGPNGAGKTTVFNLLTGVLKTDTGSINFYNKEISKQKTFNIAKLGITRTFQNLQIFSNMTVLENIMVGMHLECRSNIFQSLFLIDSYEEKRVRKKSSELLEILNLEKYAHTNCSDLPFGIQRQIEIIRGIASKPKLILLDEPAAGLNPTETEELGDKIKKILSLGISIILIEHDMNLVMRISDNIIVLNFGEKIAEGTPEQIQKNPEVIKAYLGE
ncbi:MAG: high-affinity branched-chain amino acid ABC transporter ATP-binding protein LivG [Spirochaetes bacterium GWC1_27_15]|nr:MAG: high-affinity branched-chain amino acid ABC transporter ATP-binding protein LivG [Spirochaetes bacterium GWB1_27_13]OHD20974.1 MAG: high-affinity branched-chain amino acid ABC transporter ATP-binding protein LivG [Spirochaetes bacterium GWC1_27_15]